MVSVKRMISEGVAVVLFLALAMPLAHANSPDERTVREGNRQGVGQSQPQTRNQREAKRSYAQRHKGGEEQRQQRLSPEERRQLRRDIKDAGRDIYPPRK